MTKTGQILPGQIFSPIDLIQYCIALFLPNKFILGKSSKKDEWNFPLMGGEGSEGPDFLLRKKQTNKKHGLKTLDFAKGSF